MAAEPTPSIPAGFPEGLAAWLREDACVRADAVQLTRELERIRVAAGRARSATALPGRLLAALGRRPGGPPTPEAAAEIFARENVLQRQHRESEQLLRHYTGRLDAQLAAYLQTVVPVYRQQSQARVRLVEWETIIAELRTDLRELIRMLGQARNNAVAGYNKEACQVCAAAQELFDQSNGLIRRITARVQQANDKAEELGVPGVTIIPLQETIFNLTKHEIVTMLREFDLVVRELELFEARQLVDLQVPAVAAADALVAQAHAYLVNYREQLRAYGDQQVTPEEIKEAIPLILQRFRQG